MVTPRQALSCVLVVLGSCRAIAGLHDKELISLDASCGAPSLPATGDARVRIVNAGTQGANVDFCIRPSGAADWGAPVLSAGGPSCDTGLAYAQATVPFTAPSGTIDVEVVPAGSSCDAAASSQATGIPTSAGAQVVTLLRFGGGATPEQIVALPEEPLPGSSTGTSYNLRVANALSSGQPINLGFALSPSLPTTVPTPIMPVAIPSGGVEGPTNIPGYGAVDAEGYWSPPALTYHFGVVLDGSHDPLFTFDTPGGPDTQTLFAMGDTGDDLHPARGLLCEDLPGADPTFATCVPTRLPSLAIDTFNTTLYGALSPFDDDRRAAVYDAIAARTSDLMCVLETALDADNIAQHAQAHFPYSYFERTTLATAPTDPTDASGHTPPAPTSPPCGGIDPNVISSIYQCLAQNCTTTGDSSGFVATTGCLSGPCAGVLTQLYNQGPLQDGCFNCIVYQAVSETPLSHGQQECTQDVAQPFAYDGMNTVMLLSRYPLTHQQAYILPGTGFRRAVLYAQVQLEDQTVDFYCAQLQSPFIHDYLNYVGNYGSDEGPNNNGWEDEQDLQARRAVAWITQNSSMSGRPTIIAGDWHASPQASGTSADGGSMVVLAGQSLEVIPLLDQSLGGAFVAAEPPGYLPACEQCPAPQNVYNAGDLPLDLTRMYLLGFAPNVTTDDTFWGMANTVPLMSIPYEPAPTPPVGPISGYYPRLVHVLRPAVH